eukprot:TRINITY_DN5333_c0_g1_i14.p3 TRINITY_DN5333_c0_g1~~TRINITY_DN5333_c0_g1_i14.p3  ORF type:complete len:247 (-),score=83.34 TRINITY_DN5333_c0_g1_i14:1320-2060(-)
MCIRDRYQFALENKQEYQLSPDGDETPEFWASLENAILLDFGFDYLETVSEALMKAKTLLWVNTLDPLGDKVFNELNVAASKMLGEKMENKKKLMPTSPQLAKEKEDEFKGAVGIIGEELDNLLNGYELKEPEPGEFDERPDEEDEEGMEDEEAEEEDEEKKEGDGVSEVKEKKNNIPLICDFYSKSDKFIMRILSGEHIPSLDAVHEEEKKDLEDQDEEFSFLDEIQSCKRLLTKVVAYKQMFSS